MNAVATTTGIAALGLVACALAGVALWTRRPFFSSLSLGAAGVAVFVLLLLAGDAGVAVAALACTWAVAASGLVVGSVLSGTERETGIPDRRGPWALALLASALLVASLALGLFAVDWPLPREGIASPSRTGVALSLADWLLAACAATGVATLLTLAPAPDEESHTS